MSRIFWNDDEWNLVFQAWKPLWENAPNVYTACHEAQQVLPVDRRRNFLVQPSGGVAGSGVSRKFKEWLLEEQEEKAKANGTAYVPPIKVESVAVVKAPKPEKKIVEYNDFAPPAKQWKPKKHLLIDHYPTDEQEDEQETFDIPSGRPRRNFGDVLQDEIDERVEAAIKEAMTTVRVRQMIFQSKLDHMTALLEEAFRQLDARSPGSGTQLLDQLKEGPKLRESRPRILVLGGTMKNNESEIRSAVGQFVEVLFLDGKKRAINTDDVQNRSFCDRVYIMANFTGHSEVALVKKVFNSERIEYCNTSTSGLIRAILNRFVLENQ